MEQIPKHVERTISLTSRAAEAEPFKGVSLSSNAPINRWFGREILVHDEAAINLERAGDNGLPFLINHDAENLVGRIKNVSLDDDKLRGDLQFDENDPEAQRWRRKMEDGIATDFSIRYSIDAYTTVTNSEDGRDIEDFIVTRWTPLEASCVSVPADPSCGIGRDSDFFNATRGDETMNGDNTTGSNAGQDGGAVDVAKYREAIDFGKAAGEEEGARKERMRQTQIDELFIDPRYSAENFQQLRRALKASGASLDRARAELLQEINSDSVAPGAAPASSDKREYVHASAGDDNMDKWRAGVEAALVYRFGIDRSEEAKRALGENPFAGLRLLEIGRSYLNQIGVKAGGLDASTAALMSLQRAGVISHSTSDYTSVLANVATKALTLGYMKAPETWRPFCRVVSLPDYKQAKMVNLTAFTALAEVAENAEYTEGTIGDVGENMQLATYGKMYGISRRAILNDDADAFSQIPRGMGAAAARVIGNLVYNTILLGNPTLGQDSTSLFHADHSNYVAAGAGAAPSVTTLDAAFTAMATQTDPDALETLNIRPAFLIVPKALEGTAQVLTSAMSVQSMAPGVTSGTTVLNADNRFSDVTVISDARIDASDAAKWFMAADPNDGVIDTINVAFLNGREEPYMEQQEGFTTDGVRYKVRLEATAAPIAYQGLYFNDGN